MNLRRRNRINSEVSVSSLNDIMFFLLLFFLITSTLVNPNVIKLLLPNARSGKAVSKQTITISVTKDLQYYINNKPVPFEGLESELLKQIIDLNEATVVLRIDNALSVQNLVDVLEIGNRIKVKMILATQLPAK